MIPGARYVTEELSCSWESLINDSSNGIIDTNHATIYLECRYCSRYAHTKRYQVQRESSRVKAVRVPVTYDIL